MIENTMQFKIGIVINVDVKAKFRENIMSVKKIIFGILVHVFAKLKNM